MRIRRAMIRLPVLLLLVVLFAAPAASAGLERLGDEIQPTRQAVQLTIDPDTESYSGSTRISLRVDETVTELRLNAEGIEIASVEITGPESTVYARYQLQEDILTIVPPAPLEPGEYELRIAFANEFNTQAVGLYRMQADGAGYAFTQFEATDARKAFPCFDEPAFKIPFQFTITAPAAAAVVTNTPAETEATQADLKTITFKQTKPLPSYLLAIAVGPMDSVEIPGLKVPGRIYTPRGMAHLAAYTAQMTAPILDALQRWFGAPYPYEKLDFIAIPEFWPGAMEHPGAITFSDQILLLDPSRVSANQRRRAALVIAHELAHQWFGNLVTLKWWDDLWLNESFADWMGDKIVVQLYPEMGHDLDELRRVNDIMARDARASAEAIRQPVKNAGDLLANVGVAYSKGKSVIGMFEHWIGHAPFRAGVRNYLQAHAWGNAEAADFWNALSEAAGADVATSMAPFIEQPGVPLVEAAIEGNTIALSQRRFENFGAGLAPYTWHIPVALRVGMGGQSVERTVLLAQPEMKVEFEGAAPIDWVMPAADGVGYYRWSIGDERLKSLVAMAPKALNDKERVALMGNVGASLDGGLMGGDTYMQAIRSLAGDTEPFVIAAVLDELEKVEKTFVTAELEDAFAAYTGRTLSPLLDRYGIEPRTGENATIASFRPRLLLWMGALVGDESIVAWAEKTRKQYAKDPASLDPTLAGVSLRIAASDGDSELFDDFVKHFKAADNPAQRANYLAALGAFRDAAVRERALAFALEGPLRPNELFEIPGEIADRNDGADRAFQWMTENYDQVADRMPPLFRPYLTNFADGCDIERLQRAKAFFAEPAHHVDGTDRQLGKVEAAVRDCVSLREREGAKVKAYLHGTL